MGKKYEPHERKNNIFTISLKEEGDGYKYELSEIVYSNNISSYSK